MFRDRFTTRADAYVSARPSYPPASVDAILAELGAPATLVIADLGAGTGISSRLIADRGPRVIALEPNAPMRMAALSDPRVSWIDGTAEQTTLPDTSVDVVTAFQAWHWFDHARATAEARRIARPGGRLAVVYNERDERDPFTAGYGDIARRYARDDTELRRADALHRALHIDPARTVRAEFPNSQKLDRATLHLRAESSSYLPLRGSTQATAMHADIDALVDRFGSEDSVAMHLVTILARIDLDAVR